MNLKKLALALFLSSSLVGCQAPALPANETQPVSLKIIAVESFLSDMAQNVAGDRLSIDTLIPSGIDAHSYEPSPNDLAKLSNCNLLILNGAGLEKNLDRLLQNAGDGCRVVEASSGLDSLASHPSSLSGVEASEEGDPHFWLDPLLAVRYIENIRNALVQADPPGEQVYQSNADAYILKLKALDQWIAGQVEQIPPSKRLLVTNHESLGYLADRYGFQVVGTIIPGVESGSSPSARELADLEKDIQETGAPAIFLEAGTNSQLARQIAQDTGVQVVTDLYTEFTSPPDGPAPSYIDMMKHTTTAIVQVLGSK